jgi:hypothetical protein
VSHILFSIIIPTKNRSSVLDQAITTVLRQSYPHWELIIVDNDDSNETQKVCQKFNDSRLKYVRTGGLNMSDNWERGIDEAKGDFITYLQDKNFLRMHALQKVADTLKICETDFLAWRVDCILDTEVPPRIAKSKTTGTLMHKDSTAIVENFLKKEDTRGFMPFPNYGFMSKALLARILNSTPRRLCLGLDPALGGALQILTNTPKISLLDEALFIHAYNRLSNGKNADIKGGTFKAFTGENGGCESIYYDNVPIKAVSVINGAYNEYEKLRKVITSVKLPEINMVHYFHANYQYFWQMKARGLSIGQNLKLWRDALSKQDPAIQQEVKEAMKQSPAVRFSPLKSLGQTIRAKLGIKKIENFLKGKKKATWPFKNALEYVIWADNTENPPSAPTAGNH